MLKSLAIRIRAAYFKEHEYIRECRHIEIESILKTMYNSHLLQDCEYEYLIELNEKCYNRPEDIELEDAIAE